MFEHKKRLSLPNEKLMVDYIDHLRDVVGITKGTIYNRTYNARTFLAIQEMKGHGDVTKITPDQVQKYIFKIAGRYERTTLQNVRSTLRSLFRYLHLVGKIDETILKSVPEMPQWKLSEIPDHMTEKQTAKLLSSFNRKHGVGRRNYAIAMILVQLGLRSCEVAAIEIGDIDWKSGILNVRNLKCRRVDPLPLPKEVGEAIVDYIKCGRPKTKFKEIFLCHRMRIGEPINARTIQANMRYQFKKHRMKMAAYGTHIIRRTVAGRMIQNGASLKEIADVLRHRQLDTTKIYTKINLPALREVALEWPWGGMQ